MLDWRVKYFPPVALACVSEQGPFHLSERASWRRMFDWLQRRGHHELPGRGYGLAYGDPVTDVDGLHYKACVKIPRSWEPVDRSFVEQIDLPAGTFAVCRHVGPYSGMPGLLVDLRHAWKDKSELRHDPKRPLLTIYQSDPRVTDPQAQIADICMPVLSEW